MSLSRWASVLAIVVPAALVLALARGNSAKNGPIKPVQPGHATGPTDEMGLIEVPPPPLTEGVFPCTDCHEKGAEFDKTRRELSEHDFKFEHDAEHRWCFDCHSADDRDRLRLASGDLISFTESYKLCGQCHGDKYRDWRAGVHGRRTGLWNGKKTYLLCVHCHNPHSPRFKPIQPEAPPRRPERMR
jgi:formate-dependent nitrite reductase cytochrome c552 subunit